MGEENERKKGKKCVNHVREKCETKLVNEYYSSELVNNFTHQNFLVKMVRLLGVFFSVFIKLAHQKVILMRLLGML
jgi:hypothetical protein